MSKLPLQISKEITDKYTVVSNSFRLVKVKNPELDVYNNAPKDLITVEVGDTKQPDKFYPQVKLCRWGNSENDNEVNFSVRLVDNEVGEETVKTEGEKIVWEKGNIKIENYDYQENEGGYKFVWYLKSKPASNKVEFTIQSKGLDFFYQPPLNLENTDPSLICTETQCKDAEGNVVSERPENVVGSYAVYHSTKGGMNDANGKDYKVGKAFHIFRPHLIDANGLEAWGNLHIENGIYTVEIPQDFLDKAVYPIKSNDTFGYTSIGATNLSMATSMCVTKFTLPVAGNVTIVSGGLYSGSASGENFKGIIYDDDGASSEPGTLLVAGTSVPNTDTSTVATDASFQDSNTSVALSAGDYWVGVGTDTSQGLARDSESGYLLRLDQAFNYSSPPNPWNSTDASIADYRVSAYATYTPSGGGGVVKHLLASTGVGA